MGANMRSFISDTIREWYLAEYEASGKLPEIPDTGTAFLFEEKRDDAAEEPAAAAAPAGKGAPPPEPEEDDGKIKLPPSKFSETIKENFDTYMKWDSFVESEIEKEQRIMTTHGRKKTNSSNDEAQRPSSSGHASSSSQTTAFEEDTIDLSNRPSTPNGEISLQDIVQNYEKCVVRNSLRAEIEQKVRTQIELAMKTELDALRQVLDKKSKKGKKGKKGKKDKKGKEKDPTGGQPLEKMEEDLLANGIMTVPPEVSYDDLIGNHQLLGGLASTDVLVPAGLSDLKSLLALHATMPLRSNEITERFQERVRSILLVGPPGSGKRSLAYATAHELKATMFDLSCDNLVGKYIGPDSIGKYWVNPLPAGKKHQEQFLYTVFKVAKAHQPAVIFINEADTMFFKKIPKEIADGEPKRLKKDWPKIFKKFPTGDRIIVIGTATEPFGADQKALGKVWDKVLMVPRPDYGARIDLFKYAITKYQMEDTKTGLCSDNTREHEGLVSRHNKVDLAALARVSTGFTAGQIIATVQATMKTLKSVLGTRTLTASDFLTNLSKLEPVSEELEDEYTTWYYKTPLGKKFHKLQTVEVEEDPKKGKK